MIYNEAGGMPGEGFRGMPDDNEVEREELAQTKTIIIRHERRKTG